MKRLTIAFPRRGRTIHGKARVGPGRERAGGFLGDAALAQEHAQDRVAEEAFNGDNILNIADAIYFLGYAFGGGPQPPEPFLSCGPDPTPETPEIGCDSFAPCGR
jgi:hypothetical protein